VPQDCATKDANQRAKAISLYTRGTKYYFRRRIPTDLVNAKANGEAIDIRESLGTSDRREAERLAHFRALGRVVSHSFTHDTSEQRMRWFSEGLQSGKIEDGDTFSMPYRNL